MTAGLALAVLSFQHHALAGDGATEALELRYHAELAILEERSAGRGELAEAMSDLLPGLLLEYLATRDETIALDVVDAAFVRDQAMEMARLMEEPDLAWALDVFAGPGTGYEHGLRTAIANLSDFHIVQAQRASEAALRVYEREVDRQLDRLERVEEAQQKTESQRLEASLIRASDRAALAESRLEQKAEKAAEKADQAAEKAAGAEKQAEKVAEKAEKAAEKAEEKADKAAEKADKAAEKAEDKSEKKAKQGGKGADDQDDD